MFGHRRAKTIQFEQADKKRGAALTAFDRIQHVAVTSSNQEQLLEICDTIISGRAVLASFDKVSAAEANYMLSFISGVVYALGGENFKMDNKLFLFGRKEVFDDGSLYQYVEENKA